MKIIAGREALVSNMNFSIKIIGTCILLLFTFKAADGLKYYDLVEGKGPIAEKGSTVQVWFVILCDRLVVYFT